MSVSRTGLKRETIRRVFMAARASNSNHDIICFDNALVKRCATEVGFGNPFDAVKHDTSRTLPDELVAEGYFIVHLGKGRHAFVRGGRCGFNGYHSFENIPQKHRVEWFYRESLIDAITRSEAQTISTLYNEGIIADFLRGDRNADVLIHVGRRAKTSFSCKVCEGLQFTAKSVQLEIDALFEIMPWGSSPPVIATVEAKKTDAIEFEVRQLYTAMRYLHNFVANGTFPKETEIHNLYVVTDSPSSPRSKSWFHARIYDYRFDDVDRISSIKLVKAKEYQLKPVVSPMTLGQ
ncbi:MAG: DUF6997 domain-containing protein [Candidatus Thorarchaeota archaeon]